LDQGLHVLVVVLGLEAELVLHGDAKGVNEVDGGTGRVGQSVAFAFGIGNRAYSFARRSCFPRSPSRSLV
jgi:hypothetical protein